MGTDGNGHGVTKTWQVGPPEPAPYVLRLLLDQVPLSTEDGTADAYITCVEYWSKLDSPENFSPLRQLSLTGLSRRESLYRHIHRGDFALCLPSTRSVRRIQRTDVHLCLSITPPVGRQLKPAWSPADRTASDSKESMHPLQWRRLILHVARAQPRFSEYKRQQVLLDRWARSEPNSR